MSWLTKTLSSSIGKKVLMALTGLFLCAFLVVHLIGNLQLFKHDGGYAFNTYAVFMTTFPLIKFISYGNYFFILFHAFWGLYLTIQNRQARPEGYVVNNNQSSAASRNMAIFGTILLVYLAVHMSDFWYKYHYENLPYVQYTEQLASGEISTEEMPAEYTQTVKKVETYSQDGTAKTVVVKDLYKVVKTTFGDSIIWVLLYVVAMGALAFHLMHGFQSAFQSLGLRHSKYTPLIKGVGVFVFGILIPVGYAVMPLYFYFFK